jgi:tetratricopeptide (TPR) repeat protein
MANALRTESLRRQGRTEDMLALLENLAGTGNDHSALANLIRTQVAAGETEAAREHLATLLTEAPDDLSARLLLAGLEATTGEEKTAEKLYRDLILEIPDLTQPYQALFTLLASQGRTDEAEATLEAGIARARDNGGLLFIQAGLLEARGNVDGAIANYEVLYARDSRDLVVANNLASLLTGTGADQADLDRAFAIARRLRTSDVPYFQDTYGWILHLRGDSGQAYDYLSPAAGVLPDNALVLFHLAETEFALNRREAAEATFRRALAASGTGTPLPPAQISAIEARLAEITAGETDDTAQPGKPTEG